MDRDTYTSNLNYLIAVHKAEIEKLMAEINKLKADRAPVPKMVDASTQTDMVSQTKPKDVPQTKPKDVPQTKPKTNQKISPFVCHAILQSGLNYGKECGRLPKDGGPYCGWHSRS